MTFRIGNADHVRALALAKEYTRQAGEYSMGSAMSTSQGVAYRKSTFEAEEQGSGLNGPFGRDAQQAASGKDKDKQRYFQEIGKLISSSPVMPEYSGGGPVRPNSDRREVA